jgi:hypothetical protein
MTSMSGRALCGVLTALLTHLLGACVPVDECQYTDVHCDGDVAMLCNRVEKSNGSYQVWYPMQCGAGRCKLDDYERPFCALTADPEPRCDGGSSTFCDGNALTWCKAGYAATTSECGSANHRVEFCVTGTTSSRSKQAFCAVAPDPSPLCAASENGPYDTHACDGNDQLDCHLGYIRNRISCGERSCQNKGVCVLSPDPDPSCVSAIDPRVSFCEDNAIVQCDGSYREFVRGCGENLTCRDRTVLCGNTFYGEACSKAECSL